MIIELKNLCLSISGKKIIDNLSFNVEEGERVLVRGETGSGKTTLFKVLTGLIPALYRYDLNGVLRISGESNPGKFREHVHLVMQVPEEQIVFEDVMDEIFSQSAELELVTEYAKKFRVEQLLHRKTSRLSDGEKQLIVVLAALASNKKCLIFDEPFSHLHPSRTEKLYDILFNSEKTVLFSDKRFDLSNSKGEKCEVLNLGRKNREENSFKIPSNCKSDIGEEILKAEGISFSYPDSVELLRDIDFSLSEREIALITGDNGAGKTTFLKILSGILKPNDGRVNSLEKASISFQYPNYVFTAVRVGDEVNGLDGERVRAFGLDGLIDRHPHTLSAGEAKLLSIVKALSARLVFLDEPTVYQSADFVPRLIYLLRKEGKTAVISSHDLRLAKFSDSVYELKDGKLRKLKSKKSG